MSGKRGFRAYPRHLGKPKGKGYKQCDASGFLRRTGRTMEDVRQGDVAKEFADVTPGFGTNHPQDKVNLGQMSDPSPIHGASPQDEACLSKSDLMISDQEIKASIVEGRPPRRGY